MVIPINNNKQIFPDRVIKTFKTIAYALATLVTLGLFHYFWTHSTRVPIPISFERKLIKDQLLDELVNTKNQIEKNPSSQKEKIKELHQKVISMLKKEEQPNPAQGIHHPLFKEIANASLAVDLHHSKNPRQTIKNYGYQEEDLRDLIRLLGPTMKQYNHLLNDSSCSAELGT